MKTWTAEEEDLLGRVANSGFEAIKAAFPRKSKSVLYVKCSRMGIKISRVIGYRLLKTEMEIKSWIWANRILPNLKASGDCWLWSKANLKGYGQIRFFLNGKSRCVFTHRIAWEVSRGRAIPDGLSGLHRCDNPACNNPAHIFIGTDKDNGADRHAKGRTRGVLFVKGQPVGINQVRGTQSPFAKLDDDKVREIRAIHASGEMGHKRLAKKFNVSRGVIHRVVKRTGWIHVG